MKVTRWINKSSFVPAFIVSGGQWSFEPSSIAFPFRKIFQGSALDCMTDIRKIIPDENKLITTFDRVITYDHLVIATGCRSNYFGNEEVKEHAFAMKTTQDAIDIRNKILFSFEKEIFARPEEKQAWMNIIIVGAGATGVELSGAFAERKRSLAKDYRNVDFTKFNIYLVAASTAYNMSEASREARKYLDQLVSLSRRETR